MGNQHEFDFQGIENAHENSKVPENLGISEPLLSSPVKRAECVICSAVFECRSRSSATACSEACRRERRLRYGKQYRQLGRDLRADLLNRFGGKMPTGEEIIQILKQRKSKP